MFSRYRIKVIDDRLRFGGGPLDLSEALDRLDDYAKYLEVQTHFEVKRVSDIVAVLDSFSQNGPAVRKQICAKLLKLNFIAIFENVVQFFHKRTHDQIQHDQMDISHEYQNCLSALFNYADNMEFANAVADTNLIKMVASNLKSKELLQNRNSQVDDVLRRSTGFLYNVIQNAPERRGLYTELCIDQAVISLLNDKDVSMRLDAIFILGYITDEKEAEKLKDNNCIAFLVQLIGNALSTSDHRYAEGTIYYSAEELLNGLSRIAINDVNKQKIIQVGGLDILIKAMKSENEKEQIGAVKTVYFLSFKPTKAQVKESKELRHILESLANSNNKEVKRAAKGAIFQLDQNDTEHMPRKDDSSGKHLFVSYSWGDKSIIWPLSERLKSQGFQLWIDTDDMKGSTLEAMSNAVENAWAVLLCLSENYRESPDCRTEAEYTYKLRKPIVPIVLQRSYSPKGWLGALLGNRLYVDFKKWDIETAIQKLLKQIEVHQPGNKTEDAVDGPIVPVDSQRLDAAKSIPIPTGLEGERSYQAETWTTDRVQEWVTEHKLNNKLNNKLLQFLNEIDGETLVGLCYIEKKAPEYLMKMLTKQYEANLKEVSCLVRALHKIP